MGLMAGNAVILKVASNVAHVGLFIERCVRASGMPANVFQHLILPGAKAGPAMLQAGVNKLFFTGSVPVGKELMAEAAKTLTPVSLELGGNDPMVVLEDACLERAVNCACWAGFQNAGQSCGGVERVYVHEKLYEAFLEQLCAKTRALRHGPDNGDFQVDMGSVTTKGQYESIKAQVDEAVQKGAKVVAQSRAVGDVSKGFFFPATVMTHVTSDMRLMREETFGPVLPVVSFKDDEEAIREANAISLALTSSIFSENPAHARAVAGRMESGVVTINDHLYTHGMTEAPWGGWKESGIGRTHGYLGLREMCNVKCVNRDLLPGWLAPRAIYWYPFSEASYATMLAVVRLSAPRSLSEVVKGLKTLLSNAVFMFTKWKVESKKEK
ncbi:succinate-semialdehyde dehydrogenase (NADP+) [Strigomonas culicis]|nr:succinate-semialdehyde dehydrogenase (NADP+) [Strigomonas culicis]|eukprot:EPY37128.1 succinate-semialdehyde dehydrogenase (NADP+) [Strigomonas culicis]